MRVTVAKEYKASAQAFDRLLDEFEDAIRVHERECLHNGDNEGVSEKHMKEAKQKLSNVFRSHLNLLMA